MRRLGPAPWALALAGLASLVACVPDPPPTTPPPTPSIDAVAGVDGYDPYAVRTPTAPGPALEWRANVYARAVEVVDADTVLVANYNEIVRFEEASGTVQRIAGAGTDPNSSTDGIPLPGAFGGPAVDAWFGEPHRITSGPDGSVHFTDEDGTDTTSRWLSRVTPDGTLVHVAGDGVGGRSGDGGPAVDAGLGLVGEVAVGDDGDVVFVDGDATGEVVRRIDADTGTIDTVFSDPAVPWGVGELALEVSDDGTVRDLGLDASGDLVVRRLTGPGAPVVTPVSGPCAGTASTIPLRGELADGRRSFIDRDWHGGETRICTVDLDAATSIATPADEAAMAVLFADPPDLDPIGEIGLGPDGRRWFSAWKQDFAYAYSALRLYRWDPAD